MHHGVMTCGADDSVRHVAGIMSYYRVHSVVVSTRNGGRPLGIVSDLDVTAAAAKGMDCTALEAATTEPVGISSDDSVQRVAQLMSERGVSHLVVLDRAGGYPLGILSTLDIAGLYADS